MPWWGWILVAFGAWFMLLMSIVAWRITRVHETIERETRDQLRSSFPFGEQGRWRP